MGCRLPIDGVGLHPPRGAIYRSLPSKLPKRLLPLLASVHCLSARDALGHVDLKDSVWQLSAEP